MRKNTPTDKHTQEDKSQERSTNANYSFSTFPLYEHKTPIFKENERTGYVDFGQDNNYPDYLAYLYNRSAIHASIINSKRRYICGNGWELLPNLTTIQAAKAMDLANNVNTFQTLDELTEMLMLEELIYGGYALRVKWFEGRIISLKVQGFDTIRTNTIRSEFYISNEWTAEMSLSTRWRKGRGMPVDVQVLPKFNPLRKEGEQIFYSVGHRPQMRVYPLPEYEAGIAAIETDVEIKNFDLNNIKTGFAAGTMITLFNGEVHEEKKATIERDLKRKAFGTDNAGELILNFQNPGTVEPKILALRPNDLADQYAQLDPRITNSILMSHSVTSPMLFGIKTEGQLGGRSELRTAWELFYNGYIVPKQNKLENDINYLFNLMGISGKALRIKDIEPIGIEFDLETIKEALGQEDFNTYVREKLGLKSKKVEMKAEKKEDKLLFKLLNEIGESKDNFEIVMEGVGYDFEVTPELKGNNKKVYNILVKEPEMTLAKLAEMSNISQAKLIQILEALSKGNLIASKLIEKDGVVSVKANPNETPTVEEAKEAQSEGFILETKWEYAWTNPTDASTIDRSRDFCVQMLKANKLYSREEIDNLQNDMDAEQFNQSVWRYRGGWYHNPELDVNTPQCRHFWKSVITKRRKV
jgi:hypothetical protein